jgi:hypothetical protein
MSARLAGAAYSAAMSGGSIVEGTAMHKYQGIARS